MEQPIKSEIRDKVKEELKARGYHKYQLEHLDETIFLTLDIFESLYGEKNLKEKVTEELNKFEEDRDINELLVGLRKISD